MSSQGTMKFATTLLIHVFIFNCVHSVRLHRHTSRLMSRLVPIVLASSIAVCGCSEASMYDSLSKSYDNGNSGDISKVFGVDRLRGRAGSIARGDVLEVAIGTGLQSSFYDWSAINSFTGVDESSSMLEEARRRLDSPPNRSDRPYTLTQMDVKALDFPDGAFDTVVDTFSLCVIDEPERAIKEMARVVKRGEGRVVLVENLRSDNPVLGAFQDVTEPIISASSKGKCRWNVDVERIAKASGLNIEVSERGAGGTLALLVLRK